MNRIDLIKDNTARVARIILKPKEVTPKHYHSDVIENIVCLSGQIQVFDGVAEHSQVLFPGQVYEIAPNREHYLANIYNGQSEYLLVQKAEYDFVPVG